MKHTKLLRITGIALILSLLMITIIATPTSGAVVVTINPSSGATGTTVTLSGYGLAISAGYQVYISNHYTADITQTFQNLISGYSYKYLGQFSSDTNGNITSAQFLMPTVLDSGASAVTVSAGTYYIYLVSNTFGTIVYPPNPFTVIANPQIALNPTSGLAGSEITITGTGFNVNSVLTFNFDTVNIAITAGNTATSTTGGFTSVITVPSSAIAGTHTIYATAGSTTANATFTVTASPTLDALSPATGPAGTDVVITGSAFPASTALTFQFDSTTITRKYGDSSTRTSGIFISTVTIPASASTGTHTITVTAGSASASATFTVTATATLDALSPTSGPAGTDVTISGSDFPASTAIIYSFEDTAITPKSGDTATRTSGIFSSIINIPTAATAGVHTITVTVGSVTKNTTFTVTASGTLDPLSINYGSPGADVTISGYNFPTNTTLVFGFDGTAVTPKSGDVAVRPSGLFSSTITIPTNATAGDHTITVVAGNTVKEVTFTVESTPPAAPVEASPAVGAALKKPYMFDWNDVTDASLPVKYDLQISTDSSFSSSIILNKTGLTESQYKLTDSESSTLSSDVAVYYWRVRAVDAASNASAWSSTGQFHVTKPFSFIGWPLWLTISIGGVVLFLLGYWLGRRTAFSY